MIFKTPKISDRPDAMRNRNIAVVRPERSWPSRKTGSSSSDMPRVPGAWLALDASRQVSQDVGVRQNAPPDDGAAHLVVAQQAQFMNGLGSTYLTSVMIAFPAGPFTILP